MQAARPWARCYRPGALLRRLSREADHQPSGADPARARQTVRVARKPYLSDPLREVRGEVCQEPGLWHAVACLELCCAVCQGKQVSCLQERPLHAQVVFKDARQCFPRKVIWRCLLRPCRAAFKPSLSSLCQKTSQRCPALLCTLQVPAAPGPDMAFTHQAVRQTEPATALEDLMLCASVKAIMPSHKP